MTIVFPLQRTGNYLVMIKNILISQGNSPWMHNNKKIIINIGIFNYFLAQ